VKPIILINCIEGLSASVRNDENTISTVVIDAVDEFVDAHPEVPVCINEVGSTINPVDRSIQFLHNNLRWGWSRTRVLLVGKSLGGVLTWWMLRSCWRKLKAFGRISVLTVDPHGPVFGDGVVGPFMKGRPLTWKDEWLQADHLDVVNLYQHNKFPTGAFFEGASNIEFAQGADHWNITDRESPYSTITRAKILDRLEWLIGE